MILKKLHILTVALLLVSLFSFSRTDDEQKLYKKAVENLESQRYDLARVNFLELVELNPTNADYYFQLGVSHWLSLDEVLEGYPLDLISKSIPFFEKSLALSGTDTIPDNYYYLAYAYHHDDRFEEALTNFNKFLTYLDKSKQSQKLREEVEGMIAQCNYGKIYKANPVRSVVKNLGAVVNSEFSDHSPVFVSDESIVVFTSRRPDTKGKQTDIDGQYFEDIYMTRKEAASWSYPNSLDSLDMNVLDSKKLHLTPAEKISVLNSTSHDAAITFSNGDSSLYIYRGLDIWESKYKNNVFEKPVQLNDFVNSQQYEPNVCLSADGNTLYLVSERPGGSGGKDIYISEKNEKSGTWKQPKNLGPIINSEYDEDSPFISADGKTLYFSSKGHSSMGGYDIFKSKLNEQNGEWSQPENMGYPINRAEDDIYFSTNKEGTRAYFSSDRDGGYGSMDNYLLFLDGEKTPLAEIKGLVLADNTLHPQGAKITLIDDETNKKLGTFTANETTGKFYILAPQNKCYRYQVTAEGYMTSEEKICIPKSEELYQMYQEIHIMPVKYDDRNNVICQLTKYHNAFFDIQSKTKENTVYRKYIDKTYAYSAYIKTINPDNIYTIERGRYGGCSEQEYLNAEQNAIANASKQSGSLENPTIILRNIFYDFDMATLRPESKKELEKLYNFLNENQDLVAEIGGHTDAFGSEQYNEGLSQRRAQAVVDYQLSKGISKDRLKAKGYGESKPIARNANPDGSDNPMGRQLNRRIELTIIGEQGKLNVVEKVYVKDGLDLTNSNTDNLQTGRNQTLGYTVEYKGKETLLKPKGKTNTSKGSSNKTIETNQSNTPSGYFAVQIVAFAGEKVPVEIIDQIYGLPELRTYKLNGYTKYTSGVFKTRAEADSHKSQLQSKGFNDCFVTPLPTNNSKVTFNN